MPNADLDAHFEKLHTAIAALRAPEVHVHIHTGVADGAPAAPLRKKRKSVMAHALDSLKAMPAEAPHPYVS